MPYARFINNVRGTSQFESRDEKRERKQSQKGERKKDEKIAICLNCSKVSCKHGQCENFKR